MLRLIVTLALAAVAVSGASLSETVDASCIVTSYANVAAAVANCTNIVLKGFTVPGGSGLELNLKEGTHLTFQGTIEFSHAEWDGPLVTVKGKKVTVVGAAGSVLDGNGAQYWDGKGSNGTKKPRFFKISTTGGSTYTSIKLLNCPGKCVSISASDNTLNGWDIDVSAGDSAGGHNTYGFAITANNIVVENSEVKNQDDCVSINGGSNIKISDLTCSGGHGFSLSIGTSTSNSSKNQLSDVTFSNCKITNSDNAIHVKTHTDAAAGYIKDLTFENIEISGIKKYGIHIAQDYNGGKHTGTAVGNIPITGLKLSNVGGSMSSGMGVYILCASGACSSWNWSGVSVSGGSKSNSCNFTPSGFTC